MKPKTCKLWVTSLIDADTSLMEDVVASRPGCRPVRIRYRIDDRTLLPSGCVYVETWSRSRLARQLRRARRAALKFHGETRLHLMPVRRRI